MVQGARGACDVWGVWRVGRVVCGASGACVGENSDMISWNGSGNAQVMLVMIIIG